VGQTVAAVRTALPALCPFLEVGTVGLKSFRLASNPSSPRLLNNRLVKNSWLTAAFCPGTYLSAQVPQLIQRHVSELDVALGCKKPLT